MIHLWLLLLLIIINYKFIQWKCIKTQIILEIRLQFPNFFQCTTMTFFINCEKYFSEHVNAKLLSLNILNWIFCNFWKIVCLQDNKFSLVKKVCIHFQKMRNHKNNCYWFSWLQVLKFRSFEFFGKEIWKCSPGFPEGWFSGNTGSDWPSVFPMG